MKLLWLNFDIKITNYLLRDLEVYCQEVKRISMFCVNNGIRVIEDEYHLIYICPLYQHLRSTFLQLPDYSLNQDAIGM